MSTNTKEQRSCDKLAEARAYAKANLKQCAAEIRRWQDTGYLEGEFMRNLGEICMFAREHAMQVAESLVNRAALDFIAAHEESLRDDAEQAQEPVATVIAVNDFEGRVKWRKAGARLELGTNLYAAPVEQAAQAVPALCANCAPAGKCEKRQALCEPRMAAHDAEQVQEPVATVRVHKTGGNAGIAWTAVPTEDAPLLPDGANLYAAPVEQVSQAKPAPAQAVPAVPVAYADPEDLTDADGNWIEDGNWVTVRLNSSWPLPAELRHYIPLYATAAPAPQAPPAAAQVVALPDPPAFHVLASMAEQVRHAIDLHREGASTAQAIGVLEIVKQQLIQEQQ